MTEFQNSKQIK